MLAIWIIIFIVTLAILVKAADYFTNYAEKLGTILKISPFVVGVLIIAIGTSMPELVTSIFGVVQNQNEFLPANIMGTVIVNILLGLGIAALFIKKIIKFNWNTVANDMPFMVGAVILLGFMLADGKIAFWENLILIGAFVIYVFYAFRIFKLKRAEERKDLKQEIKEEVKEDTKDINGKKLKKGRRMFRLIAILVLSLAAIAVAGHFVVDSLIHIATIVGIGSSILAASAVAIGTSLPEIVVAISAARRGNFDMVLGGIMGSNIFDI